VSTCHDLCPVPSPVLGGLKIAGLAVILADFEEISVATLGMAFSVLEHAEQSSAVGRWQCVADLWTPEEILEELRSVEDATRTAFVLDVSAICHFDMLLHGDRYGGPG